MEKTKNYKLIDKKQKIVFMGGGCGVIQYLKQHVQYDVYLFKETPIFDLLCECGLTLKKVKR